MKWSNGYAKIEATCKQARADYLGYAWVDTCCIDKTSSAELSEAIDSMFNLYKNAVVCYVHLADVNMQFVQALQAGHTVAEDGARSIQCSEEGNYAVPGQHRPLASVIGQSRWFTRGWTLQELLAPTRLCFFDQTWRSIGRLSEIDQVISKITNIPLNALRHYSPLSKFSIAKRMCWASSRDTTVVEDGAYCLLGIFGISMPLLYGEKNNAFIRLQHEIVRISGDHSLFAWGSSHLAFFFPRHSLLASSAHDFRGCDTVAGMDSVEPGRTFELTNQGVRMSLPVIRVARPDRYLALLSCYDETMPHQVYALQVTILESGEAVFYGRSRTTCPVKSFRRRQRHLRTIIFTGRSLADITSSSAGAGKLCLRFNDCRIKKHTIFDFDANALSTEYSCTLKSVTPQSVWDTEKLIWDVNMANRFSRKLATVGFEFVLSDGHGHERRIRVILLDIGGSHLRSNILSAAVVEENVEIESLASALDKACAELEKVVTSATTTSKSPWVHITRVLRNESRITFSNNVDLLVRVRHKDAMNNIQVAICDRGGVLRRLAAIAIREWCFLKDVGVPHWLSRTNVNDIALPAIRVGGDSDVLHLSRRIVLDPVVTMTEELYDWRNRTNWKNIADSTRTVIFSPAAVLALPSGVYRYIKSRRDTGHMT